LRKLLPTPSKSSFLPLYSSLYSFLFIYHNSPPLFYFSLLYFTPFLSTGYLVGLKRMRSTTADGSCSAFL
jgi:hypothetical protein